MIIPTTKAYYITTLSTRIAEELLDAVCEEVSADISSVTVLSKVKDSDIECVHDLQKTMDNLKGLFSAPLEQTTEYNPLYFHSSNENLFESLSTVQNSTQVEFHAVDKNPYTAVMATLTFNEEPVVTSVVRFREFELPSYEDITTDKRILN